MQRKEDMRGLLDRHALTLAGQHRQGDMVGGWEKKVEGGREHEQLARP